MQAASSVRLSTESVEFVCDCRVVGRRDVKRYTVKRSVDVFQNKREMAQGEHRFERALVSVLAFDRPDRK